MDYNRNNENLKKKRQAKIMKILWRMAKEAKRHRFLLMLAGLSTIILTGINLVAPGLLTRITEIVSKGVTNESYDRIVRLVLILLGVYLSRILFRYLSNYLAHKAGWELVQEVRMKVYNRMQTFSMSFFHNKQTGDLMSRVVNDTATFELIYAHLIPETVTNTITLVGSLLYCSLIMQSLLCLHTDSVTSGCGIVFCE